MLAFLWITFSVFGSLPAVLGASGVTTFNDYTTQSGVACSGFSPVNSPSSGIYAAALGDLSPLWTGAKCGGSQDKSKCTGTGQPISGAVGPSCPGETQCGKCFNIKCVSNLDSGDVGKCTGNTIKVKIIDACPSTHPANYCKIAAFGGTIPNDEACEASGVNAFDIATTARSALSSYGGNLNIDIESTSC